MIFGSTAIKHHYSDFRDPKDLDMMIEGPQGASDDSTRQVEKYWWPEFQEVVEKSEDKKFLDPHLVLTVKASHANWNIWWAKTMHDIVFLKRKGCEIDKDLYFKLVKRWRKVHGREAAPLRGRTSKDFFDDAVDRKYDHDSLHEVVAFNDRPVFYEILKEEGRVECCENKFNNLPHAMKIQMAKEEIYVTALERFIIPGKMNKGRAYCESLKKFVTTMSSGWMSFFLIDNFEELTYDGHDYVELLTLKKSKLKLN